MIPEDLVLRFTSRADGNLALHTVSEPEARRAAIDNRRRVLSGLGFELDDLVVGDQIHGAEVVRVRRFHRGRGARDAADAIRAADGLVTDLAGIPLMVLTADCPTLCLYAPAAGAGGPAIAVIHAGWRGIVAGVVEAGFVALGAADPGAIRCFLGPCAGPCCYEVGPEVASRFPVGALRVRPGGEGGGSPRVQLDLAAAIRDRLAAAVGLPLVLEAVAPGCTICDRGEQWFSHRRSRTSARQGLIAALRPRIP